MASTSSTLKSSPRAPKKSFACLRLQNSFVNGAFLAMISRHLLFDLDEIVEVERLLLGEVVIEAVLDDGADRHLRLRPQRLYGLGHDVCGIVPDQLERFRIAAGDELDRRILGDRIGEIGEIAVEAHGHGALGQRRRDGLGHAQAGRARLDLTRGAVRERQGDLFGISGSRVWGGRVGHTVSPLTRCLPTQRKLERLHAAASP